MKRETWEDVARMLPGRKRLILGNHDTRPVEYYEEMGYKVLEPFVARIGVVRVKFTHEPELIKTDEWDLNVHGHVHNNDHRELPNGDTVDWRRNVSIEMVNYRPIQVGDALTL
jgi:calcineurin-like phosphoesterase family protein